MNLGKNLRWTKIQILIKRSEYLTPFFTCQVMKKYSCSNQKSNIWIRQLVKSFLSALNYSKINNSAFVLWDLIQERTLLQWKIYPQLRIFLNEPVALRYPRGNQVYSEKIFQLTLNIFPNFTKWIIRVHSMRVTNERKYWNMYKENILILSREFLYSCFNEWLH